MPNEFLRNLNTGLGLASQINQYSSNQMALNEQRRQVQEQEQYRGALSSLREGRGLPEGTPANIGMQAKSDYTTFRIQEMEAKAYTKAYNDKEQGEALAQEILSNPNINSYEDLLNSTKYNPDSDKSFRAWNIASEIVANTLLKEEKFNSFFKKRAHLKASEELQETKINLHEAQNLVRKERNEEASKLALETINKSHSPYFLEETEPGVYSLYFKDFGDDGERQLIREGMSLKEVSEEVDTVTTEMSYFMNLDRLEQLREINSKLSENETILYTNTGESYTLPHRKTYDGNSEVFIEFPNGKILTDNQGQPVVFSSEAEARQALKQFLSEADENFRGLDEDARTALSFNEKKERESGPMSIPDSARIHSAVLEALEDSDMILTDVQARKLSSQVADLMSEKGEGKELNEAIVQVFKQFIEDDPHLKERTKGFDWSKWIGPGQGLKAGDLLSRLIKAVFKGRDRDYVEVDFNDTSSGEGEDPLNERDLGIDHNLFK